MNVLILGSGISPPKSIKNPCENPNKNRQNRDTKLKISINIDAWHSRSRGQKNAEERNTCARLKPTHAEK